MKVVFIIFGILALLGVAGGSLLLSARNGNEAKGMEEIEGMGALGGMASKMAESMLGGELPSKGAWQTAQIFSYVALLVGIFGLIALFLKGSIPMIAAGAVALVVIILWVLQPSIPSSAMGGVDPKTLAMIIMINGLIGAGCIFGVYSANKKKTA